mmetsp:Transcript_9199/g.22545  ORF Transcript_9199/g.22545 Transcript_9199/m.22545 type:complete len:229 (+) Transcript_9199:85-771(+)
MNRTRSLLPVLLCATVLGKSVAAISGSPHAFPTRPHNRERPTFILSNGAGLAPFLSGLSALPPTGKHVIAAAVARCSSLLLFYPIDTIKCRTQAIKVGPTPSQRAGSLYRGAVTNIIVGEVPYIMITFALFRIFSTTLAGWLPCLPPALVSFFAALIGETFGCLWLVPNEIVKQRIQSGRQPSIFDAVRSISTQGGFYRGFISHIARDSTFRGLQLSSYGAIRRIAAG